MDITTVPVTTGGIQEEAQHGFKQAADDGGTHNGTVGNHTAAHGGSYTVEDSDETGGGAHDNWNLATHGANGEKLNQSDNACHQHSILQQVQLQIRKFTAGNAAGTGDNQQGGQIANEHGKNVLQAQGNGLL